MKVKSFAFRQKVKGLLRPQIITFTAKPEGQN